MSLEAAESEIRERFTEASLIIKHLRGIEPTPPQPVDTLQKSLRGLCVVSIYAAVERAANTIVENALAEMTSRAVGSYLFIAPLQGLLHHPKLQSVRQCGKSNVFDRSTDLISATFSTNAGSFPDNPLAEELQNVDGKTLEWIATLFGSEDYTCSPTNRVRLSNLRERRNAVAHGRESASMVGERFNVEQLKSMYDAADAEITRFLLMMRERCDQQMYVRSAA